MKSKQTPPDDTPVPSAGLVRQVAGHFFAVYVLARWLVLFAVVLTTVVLVSTLVGARTASTPIRLALGLGAALLLPLIARWRLRQLLGRRFGRPRIAGSWFFVSFNLAAIALVCLGFSNDVGRSLRRRGDWFLGETDGWLPRRYRQGMTVVSRWLERFDIPEDAQDLLADAARPQPAVKIASKTVLIGTPEQTGSGGTTPLATSETGTSDTSPDRAGQSAGTSPWFHPLSGPMRAMPRWASCRFGAARPGRRPPECELGHCGVDLFQSRGAPVFAVREGVVLKIQRDAHRGGSSGKYLWVSHKNGAVISVYVHLEKIRADLRIGSSVHGGEPVGRLGRTGIKRSAPHLHFGIAIKRPGRRIRFMDPEPLLWFWRLPAREDLTPAPFVAGVEDPASAVAAVPL